MIDMLITFALGLLVGLYGPMAWRWYRDDKWAREERKVEAKFPGWRRTVRSQTFEKWLHTQPEAIRAKAYSERSADAIDVLERFFAK